MNEAFVDHIEVNVTDLARAREFFTTIFGWSEIWQPWGEEYALVSKEAGWVSFGFQLVDKMPEGSTVAVMRVESIEDALDTVIKAGGKVTREKFEIDPSVGFAAYFEDPFGNSWGFHSPPESK